MADPQNMPRLTPERVRSMLAELPPDSGDPADVQISVDGPRELARRKMALCVASEALARDVLALHDALAAVTRDRDAAIARALAAEARLSALAGAVRGEREAKERVGVEHNALVDANDYAETRGFGWDTRLRVVSARHREAVDARIAATDRITALLSGAPADVVRGDVVRTYLAAHDRVPWVVACDGPQLEREADARTALDAALKAARGGA